MIGDPRAVRKDGATTSLFVYGIDFFTAFFGAFYFMISSANLKSLPPMTLLFLMSFYLFFFSSCMSKVMSPEAVRFSNDPKVGCFGFLNEETWMFCYFVYGIFCSVMYTACSVLSLFFFSPLVVSNAFLMEPFVA